MNNWTLCIQKWTNRMKIQT